MTLLLLLYLFFYFLFFEIEIFDQSLTGGLNKKNHISSIRNKLQFLTLNIMQSLTSPPPEALWSSEVIQQNAKMHG